MAVGGAPASGQFLQSQQARDGFARDGREFALGQLRADNGHHVRFIAPRQTRGRFFANIRIGVVEAAPQRFADASVSSVL